MIRPLHQIHLKILALLSAVVLWFIVITVENTVYKFPDQIDVEIKNLSKNLNLEESLPAVNVYLRVDKEDLKKITKNDLEVYVDLVDIEAGEQTLEIEASSKSAQAQVLKVEPSEVALKISPIIEKEVEVKIVTEGSPAEDRYIEETDTDTDKVVISGAQTVLDEIDYVEAKLILDGSQDEDFKQNVTLVIPTDTGIAQDLVTITPEELLITAEISSETQQKEITINPVFNSDGDRTAFIDRIEIVPSSIMLEGKGQVLSEMEKVDTTAIEVSSLVRNRSVDVELNLPEGVKMLDPQDIVIRLKETNLGTEPTI